MFESEEMIIIKEEIEGIEEKDENESGGENDRGNEAFS